MRILEDKYNAEQKKDSEKRKEVKTIKRSIEDWKKKYELDMESKNLIISKYELSQKEQNEQFKEMQDKYS